MTWTSELVQLKPNIGASDTIVSGGDYRRNRLSHNHHYRAEGSDSTPPEVYEEHTPTYRSGGLENWIKVGRSKLY